jgi:hypothetical protein
VLCLDVMDHGKSEYHTKIAGDLVNENGAVIWSAPDSIQRRSLDAEKRCSLYILR